MKELGCTTSSEIENTQGDGDFLFEGIDPTKKIKQPKPIRFPEKAFNIISECDKNEPDVASWSVNGDLLIIRDKASFEKDCLSISFESFIRQLHMYGFKKINDKRSGSNKGGSKNLIFRNKDFKKGRPELLCKIQTLKKEKKKRSLNSNRNDSKTPVSTTLLPIETLNHRMDRMEGKIGELQNQIKDILFKFEAVLQMIASTPTIPVSFSSSRNKDKDQIPLPMVNEEKCVTCEPPSPKSYHRDLNPQTRRKSITSGLSQVVRQEHNGNCAEWK